MCGDFFSNEDAAKGRIDTSKDDFVYAKRGQDVNEPSRRRVDSFGEKTFKALTVN